MELYPFQSDLVEILGNPLIRGRLIGDEPGLGKTLEGLAIDRRLRKHAPGRRITLIVAPRSTHERPWADTIADFCGSKSMVIDRKDRAPFVKSLLNADHDYYVCHYEAMRLIVKDIRNVNFFHIILDETHRIKNRKAQMTVAVKSLNALYKTSMSGTPADNRPEDLWSTLNFLYPQKYRSYWKFVNTYCDFEEVVTGFTGAGQTVHRKITGPKTEALPELRKAMSMFYMRRLKKDVLKDLPDKYYSEARVDLHPQQRKIYNALKSEMLAFIGEHEDEPLRVPVILAQLVRLQQAALAYLERGPEGKVRLIEPSAKLDALVDMIRDESIGPVVIFSQSKSMIYLTENRLRREGLRVTTLTGDTPDADRQKSIDGFQAGKFDAFLATIATGGEGITLTRASTVIFLDRSWKPSANLQAEDRLHRVGQKSAVQVIDIIARDSVDSKVRAANVRKWAAIRAILGDT